MEKSEENVHDGRFSGTGGAHDADRLALLNFHIGVTEDISVTVRIVEGNILQLNPVGKVQSGTCDLGGTGTHLALGFIGFGQVVVQIIQAGLLIGSLSHVGVDAVGTGKDPDGSDRKSHQLRNQSRDVSSAEHVEGDKAHDADHEDGLDHEAGKVIEDRIIRGDIGTDFAAFIIVADEEILTIQNLDVLQAVDCLQPPLGNAGLDVLVSCADAV